VRAAAFILPLAAIIMRPVAAESSAARIRRHMMSRISTVDPNTATGEARRLLDAVKSQLGAVPNFIRVLANSPKALEGFIGPYVSARGFTLDTATQERIALVVAESNACQYCVSAHTAVGEHAGLSKEEMLLNRRGESGDARAAAALAFARALNEHLGDVTTAELDDARAAGLSPAEIVEVIAVVALNIYTNIIGKAMQVDIDFPKVDLLDASARRTA
jgi:uncharacterized peroxidase-related enzyme